MLALGMIAALPSHGPSHAATRRSRRQAVHEREGKRRGSLEAATSRAIQLATYTAASVDGSTIVGCDLTTNTGIRVTAAAKVAGAHRYETVNGENDPMVWVVKNCTDSRSDPWSELRNFCNSLAKRSNFDKQDGTAVFHCQAQSHHVDRQHTRAEIYAIVDRTPATTT